VILCEGPGEIWRLDEAGIYNGLGLFGAHFNDGQAHKLERLHIHNLIIATDNDAAGQKVREHIESKVGRLYNIYHIIPNRKDIGETTIEEIKELFSVLPAGLYG
jgi:5S rRNA maturation endonuclease (ribonuclease M5)